MQAAPQSLSLATPLMAKLVADYVQFRQEASGGSNVDPNGLYGKLIAQLDNALMPLAGQALSDSQTSPDQVSGSSVPTPYSTDGIPSDVQADPMAQLQPDDVARMQNFNASPMMANLRTSGDEATVGGGTIIRDHRPIDTGNEQVIVRDHRHPVPTPPPVYAPPAQTSSDGTIFTSGQDYDRLSQANDDMQAAKQNALDNPTDPAAQLQFQEAAQALQLLTSMLTQISSMFASIADNSIKASKVTPS